MRVDTDVNLKTVLIDDRPRHQGAELRVQRDGQLLNLTGSLVLFDPVTDKPRSQPFRIVATKDSWEVSSGRKGGSVITSTNVRLSLAKDLQNAFHGGALNGYFPGDEGKRLTEHMAKSTIIRVERHETIGGVPCQVVAASTPYGKVREWIAPTKGYLALKVVCEKGPKDLLYSGKTISEQPMDNSYDSQSLIGMSFVLDSVETTQAGQAHVPTAGRLTVTERLSKGRDRVVVYSYKYSDIVLNPDFGGSDAFVPMPL
jgi:hypothetical protein